VRRSGEAKSFERFSMIRALMPLSAVPESLLVRDRGPARRKNGGSLRTRRSLRKEVP
jgi:hypothetical protein